MIDTDKYEGHNKSWKVIEYIQDIRVVGELNEIDAQLIADAPLLLEYVKGLTKTLELIAKEMPYDSWMHTLINDVIGYEKWQAKEMKKND
jgi:hypothetical protein